MRHNIGQTGTVLLLAIAASQPVGAAMVPMASAQPATMRDVADHMSSGIPPGLDPRDIFIQQAVASAVERSIAMPPGTLDASMTDQDTCVVQNGIANLMAPDTPRAYVDYLKSLPVSGPTGRGGPKYVAQSHWTNTATNGDVPAGEPITLTYSFVPDGTPIAPDLVAHPKESSDGSNLYAVLNFQYFTADPNVWKEKFRSVFRNWGAQIGVKYVEVGDDGSPMGSGGSLGELGKRGDIRIGGHYIDGGSNILAYCYLPQTGGAGGDMVLDCDNNPFHAGDYWAGVTGDYQRIRYVVAHEHGHGLGLQHVQPLDHTKLMEPIVNDNFAEPQDDDIRGGQHQYGDTFESNDSAGAATALGTVRGQVIVRGPSIQDPSDTDWYRLDLSGASRLNIFLQPMGSAYDWAPYDANNPTYGTPIDTTKQIVLGVDVVAADGNTVLGSGVASALGASVTLNAVSIPAANHWCYVRVQGESAGGVQRYSLVITQYYSALYVDWKALGYMDGTPQYPFDTVTAALDAATPSIDTIFLRAGGYRESFPNGIGKPVTLVNWDNTAFADIFSP